MVKQAPVICVMAPPIHLGTWSMAYRIFRSICRIEYKLHPFFRPVTHGFVWLLYLTRTSATPVSGIARTDGRLHSRRRVSCVQDRLDTSDRSDVTCPRREPPVAPRDCCTRYSRVRACVKSTDLFSHLQYKSHVANLKQIS